MRRLTALLLALLVFLGCVWASAEETGAGSPEEAAPADDARLIKQNPYLDIALACLEEGNPFLVRYNEITGAGIVPMLKTGMPYYFGGQDFSRLLTVGKLWETTRYGIKGKKYVYGFDCVGFVRYIQTQMGDPLIPSLSTMILKRTDKAYKDYCLSEVMELTVPVSTSYNSTQITVAPGKRIKKPKKYPEAETEHEIFTGVSEMLEPGDLLAANHGGRHVMMYMGTMRQYGYTEETAGEMAGYLDYPLFINCVWNPDYVPRMEAYIAENGLDALPNKGGVCVTVVGMRYKDAPHITKDTERVKRPKDFYYYIVEDYHLSVLDLSAASSYVWWRTPEALRGTAK